MEQVVNYNAANGVATITLNNGKVNAISHQVIEEFNLALDKAEQDKAVVVITGSEGMFSAGYDLTVMKESMASAMALVEKGSKLTRRLLSFPFPVVAACTGHAVAKGAFILLVADYRIGIQGKFKIGLNEVAIGMSMHYAGIEMARGRMTPAYFNRSVILAEMFAPEKAIEAGFLDMTVPPEAFTQTVNMVAGELTKLDMRAHHETKLKAREGWLAKLDSAIHKDTGGSL